MVNMYLRSLNNMAFLVLWYILYFVQVLLSYGTAYRLAKTGGDNGVSLYGWLFLTHLASLVPGVGIYLWYKYRDLEGPYDSGLSKGSRIPLAQQKCSKCAQSFDYDMSSCPHCGFRPVSASIPRRE